MAVVAALGIAGAWAAYKRFDRTPGEVIRYTEHRLIGHPKLEFFALPLLHAWRQQVEHPIEGILPTLGKGQQAQALPPQQYSAEGLPLAVATRITPELSLLANQQPANEAEILQAIASVGPGQTIEIAPGTYTIKNKISVQTPGQSGQPIVVRARTPGSVTLQFAITEGFHIAAPYWVFENLVIRGHCKQDSRCEHAFHVVGKAHGTVIRNNRIEDFNAQIKINGENGNWPDDGLIQYNTLTNSRPRDTANSVTPIDLVGASRWQVADNLISNFVKGEGNQISYGVFMKGAGSNGRIERNLIICASKDISQPGVRVGLSFGGGGTGPAFCRDKRCITEHSQGIAANNIIAHCNDFGIYINKANQTLIAHNTLINTYGIDVRFPSSSALVYGNLLEGRVRARDGGDVDSRLDHIQVLNGMPPNVEQLANIASNPMITDDFCLRPRRAHSLPGAMSVAGPCLNPSSFHP